MLKLTEALLERIYADFGKSDVAFSDVYEELTPSRT